MPAASRPLRILLVEDYDVNRSIVKAFLKALPYQIDEAENGRIGVEKFQARPFDLVLMDVQMPVMDGYAATRAIRAWEKERGRGRVPIVALTAHAFEEDLVESRQAGCDAHLTKPYTKKRLIEAVLSAIGEKAGDGRADQRPSPAVGAAASGNAVTDADIEALVPAFLKDLEGLIRRARAAARNNDFETIRKIGHTVKGAGGSFGFDNISELGKQLEIIAAYDDGMEIERTLADLQTLAEGIREHDGR